MGFFKAYDMRGTFGVDVDLETVRKVGWALPQVMGGRRWLVGRDCRTTSASVRDALVEGLTAAGAEVTDLGLATTPMIYFFTVNDGFDGSVMITASHNPPSDNGLKVSKKGGLPVGYDAGLKDVEALCRKAKVCARASGTASVTQMRSAEVMFRYTDWMLAHGGNHAGLKFAVDCSDGSAGILAKRLFPDAVILNDTPDGRFPHHSPNPLKDEAREQLAAVVREQDLDCGVIFDGDADRAMFVDEKGAFIQPDYLIPIVAETFGEKGAVIHDVRTSRAAIERLTADGFTPVMGKVGHAFAKVLLRETDAVCGGELAGHYYFRDFVHCDSGELAALRILSAFAAAKRKGLSVSALMAPMLGKYANSGEVNFTVDDKPAAIARVLAVAKTLAAETGRSEIDGYRIEYAEGWVSVRQSNTESLLRLIVECDTQERMKAWLAALSSAVQKEAPGRRFHMDR